MAKISFNKLGLKMNQEVKTIQFNEQNIEIKQYLPIGEKLDLISNVINNSADDNGFSNPVKIHIFTVLEVINFYTNITFTDKQKEDVKKLYDLFKSSGLMTEIINTIPASEYQEICDSIIKSIDSIYSYRNSVMGILDTISTDYGNLSLNADMITDKLLNDNNLSTLKSLTTLVQ